MEIRIWGASDDLLEISGAPMANTQDKGRDEAEGGGRSALSIKRGPWSWDQIQITPGIGFMKPLGGGGGCPLPSTTKTTSGRPHSQAGQGGEVMGIPSNQEVPEMSDDLEYCGRLVPVPAQELSALRARVAELERRFTAPIVCMCGSTKFKQAWISENARLTGEGNIVLAVGLWGHHERVFPDAETKARLDNLHKRKIDLCDWVRVLDINGYIGESTRSEIDYALGLGKEVRYLSIEYPNYEEPIDKVRAQRDKLREALSNVHTVTLDDGYDPYEAVLEMDRLARRALEGCREEGEL